MPHPAPTLVSVRTLLVSLSLCALAGCGGGSIASAFSSSGVLQTAGSTDALTTDASHAIATQQQPTLCLDAVNLHPDVGTQVRLWSCDFHGQQSFTVDADGLVHVLAGLCLAADPTLGAGAVTVQTCSAQDTTQKWRVQDGQIQTQDGTGCLSTGAAEQLNAGDQVSLVACAANDPHQLWTLGSAVLAGVPAASGANTVQGIVQGGTGWPGDVNVASNSADYLGLTLDQLEASGSDLGELLKQTPKVEQAIRQVSAETGVPSGLLAGVCYQESSFDVNAVSNNPNPTSIDTRDVGITQAPYEDFNNDSWKDPATNLRDFIVKQEFLSGYLKHKSWGYMLRIWNTGEVVDVNDLSKQNNNTDSKYITEILATHCLGKD